MKRIYDFSRKPAKRNYTISDLQNLKITGQKLSMANPLMPMKSGPVEMQVLIYLFAVWIR